MADLGDLTAQCIRCGFCLESCPTFVLTGDESQSPRGRIQLSRAYAESGTWDDGAQSAIDSCLGCRACETACPSGVQYGKILELSREFLPVDKIDRNRLKLLNSMTVPSLARLQFRLSEFVPVKRIPDFLSRRISGESAEADIPTIPDTQLFPPLDESELPAIRGEVYLLLGCVMSVLYPHVHEVTRRLLRRVGYQVRETSPTCCGAMHAHSGFFDEAEAKAQKLASMMEEDLPIIVNAAGCGSAIKEYGYLIGKGLESTANRTFDAVEFLHQQGLQAALGHSPGLNGSSVTYHDACHLHHGQKISSQPRQLLRSIPGVDFVELGESDMCCGSAGTYNLFQPTMARRLLDRKWSNVAATSASILATGNPGCDAWIAQAAKENGSSLRVMHTLDVLESSFIGLSR